MTPANSRVVIMAMDANAANRRNLVTIQSKEGGIKTQHVVRGSKSDVEEWCRRNYPHHRVVKIEETGSYD